MVKPKRAYGIRSSIQNRGMSGVFATPNPGVVDEKCMLSLHHFDLLGKASNNGLHTLYLGVVTRVYDLSHLQMETISYRVVILFQVVSRG